MPKVSSAGLNSLPCREAMGLEQALVRRTDPFLLADHDDLSAKSKEYLIRLIDDAGECFARRHAAGHVLGLRGDPRISPLRPAMIDIPGGRVRCGTDHRDVDGVLDAWAGVGVARSWIEKECPSFDIELPPFRIARYPVTNLEYMYFLEDAGYAGLPTSWPYGIYPSAYSNHPVWTVTPDDADAFARWLARRTGRPFRLPSEAEWEYAAGGGDGREYPWGATFEPSFANTVEAGPLFTTPVGIYPEGVSPFGIVDMGGNVEELVADRYEPYPGGSPVVDDLGSAGSYRIARGGSFTRFGDLTRCRRRHGWFDSDLYAIGFRLAETA